VNFDRSQLEERRRIAEHETVDILVWSNERVIKWITSIGLKVSILIVTNRNYHSFDQLCVKLTIQNLGIC